MMVPLSYYGSCLYTTLSLTVGFRSSQIIIQIDRELYTQCKSKATTAPSMKQAGPGRKDEAKIKPACKINFSINLIAYEKVDCRYQTRSSYKVSKLDTAQTGTSCRFQKGVQQPWKLLNMKGKVWRSIWRICMWINQRRLMQGTTPGVLY